MSLLADLIGHFVAQGVVPASACFGSSSASIPAGLSQSLVVTETGGLQPSRTQNTTAPSAKEPTAQIVARGSDYPTARALAQAAYDACTALDGTTLGTTRYLHAWPMQEPFDLPADTQGRPRVAFNIRLLVDPS